MGDPTVTLTLAGVAMVIGVGVAWGALRSTVMANRQALMRMEEWMRSELAGMRADLRDMDRGQRALQSRFDRARGREEARTGSTTTETMRHET